MARWTVLFAFALAACDGKGGSVGDDTDGAPADTDLGDTDAPIVVEDATWDDVAPILEARCTGCHQADGVGPMSFATYDDTVPWAAAIKVDTADRIMPPWLVTGDGSCGTFHDS